MKILFLILATLLFANLAQAEKKIDSDLQAVITSEYYSNALNDAANAVKNQGASYILVLGTTSTLKFEGPDYFFYIPIVAVRVPLSRNYPTIAVGSIVAQLIPGLNSPIPTVEGLYFKPAAEVPRIND